MTGWLIEALVASAVLMGAVLLVRAPVRRVFGPQVAYALWALPVLRLVLPPLPAGWHDQAALPIARAGEAATVLILPATDLLATATTSAAGPAASTAAVPAAAMADVAPLPWAMIVAALWAAGSLAFFLYHFLRHRRFCDGLLRDARTLDEVDGVRVVETPAAAGPLAFGLAVAGLGRRFVAFPDDFADRYDADERELALAHELGHHARGDLFANWVALAVLAVHWFNPLAWRAFRAFRADQELANDARVLAGRSRADRHVYACAIVKAAHGGAIAATCHLHTISDLKGRLRMLSINRLSRTRLAAGTTAVAGLVTVGLVVTASSSQAAAAFSAQVENATGVRIAAPAVPTVPQPPAVPAAIAAPARVVVTTNGRTRIYEGEAASRYLAAHPVPPVPPVPVNANIPASVHVTRDVARITVREGDCQPGTSDETVINRRDGGTQVMIVCRNRIRRMAEAATRLSAGAQARAAAVAAADAERQAAFAQRQAEGAERQAMLAARRAEGARRVGTGQALASIDMARRAIQTNRALSDSARRDALAGLDDAARELRDNAAD